MELETQKAVGSIPAPSSGIVTKIYVKQGMDVAVGQALIALESSGAASAKPAQAQATAATEHHRRSRAAAANPGGYHFCRRGKLPLRVEKWRAATRAAGGAQNRARTRYRSDENQRQRSRRQINLGDVRDYIQRLQQIAFHGTAPTAQPAPAGAPTPSEAIDFAKWGPIHREKMSPLRRTVSRRMVESWTTIPKINQFADADITALLALRKKHAASYEKKGAHLTFTSFLLLVLGRALKKHPRANCQHG